MPKKKDPVPGPMTPKWVTTFADMVSLLVTFFIMLMTYSSMEKEMYAKMVGSLQGAFGPISDPKTRDHRSIVKPPPSVSDRTPNEGLRTSRTDLERIEESAKILVRKRNLGKAIQIESSERDVRIRLIGDSTPFAVGSSALTQEVRGMLREMADLLRLHRRPCVVVGHAADEGEVDAIALSMDRALAAARYLNEVGRVPTERIYVGARGNFAPIDQGTSNDASQANRRLEIWLAPAPEAEDE